MRWIILALAVLLAAVSLLNLVRAPDWSWVWKLAIIVGEFGHWLVLLPLGLAVVAVFATGGGARVAALALCAVAVVALVRPLLSARRLAENLPRELRAAFGGEARLAAFSIARLYFHGVAPRRPIITATVAQPDGQELKLDFYPAAPAGGAPAPCLVVVHGGGWDSGDRAQLAEWNHRWAARGYAVAAVSYRLAPKWIWPAQRDDVLAALAWLKVHAARLNLDPTRLVLLGRSAGGQIAAAVAYGAHDPAIRGVVSLYAPQDMRFAWSVSREDDALNSINLMRQYFGGPPDSPERIARYESASGQLLLNKSSPPTLLIHGVPDTLSWERHSERLTLRLEEVGVPHYYLRLPWATHGFDYNLDGPGGQLADCAIDQFLAAVTAP
ncbi:MAG: alpha/beta hydrolase [Opitutae bacterium]|nr:alpha/beta hydrolase [Opitutae bacterium]